MTTFSKTAIWLTSSQPYGKCGVPTIDANGERIWAIWKDGGRTYPTIEYSDDYGDSWTEWAELSGTAAPLEDTDTLIIDSAGNCYYNCLAQSGSPFRGIGRVDATTKAVTRAFNFYVTTTLVGVQEWATRANQWNWTLDDAGNLYIGTYCAFYKNSSGEWVNSFSNFNAHYIWKSTDNGLTWSRLDYLVDNLPNAAHIHAMHCNPYDNVLWANTGDASRETLYSTDGGVTFTPVSSSAGMRGFTGLTFTSTQTLFGDDLWYPNTRIWKTPYGAKSPLEASFTPPRVRGIPIYYLRAVGDNELWATYVNDLSDPDARGALVHYQRNATDEAWVETVVVESPTGSTATSTVPFIIAHNGRGVIPESHPYVYYDVQSWGGTQGDEAGVYRIVRPSDTDNVYHLDVELGVISTATTRRRRQRIAIGGV